LLHNELIAMALKQGKNPIEVFSDIDLQDDLSNLFPITLLDPSKNVQLTLFYVDLE